MLSSLLRDFSLKRFSSVRIKSILDLRLWFNLISSRVLTLRAAGFWRFGALLPMIFRMDNPLSLKDAFGQPSMMKRNQTFKHMLDALCFGPQILHMT